MAHRLAPLIAAAAVALGLTACGGEDNPPPRPAAQEPAPSATVTPPRDPAAAVAADLTATQRAVREQARTWRRDGDPAAGDAPPALAALAARAGRIHRELARSRERAARVLPLLPPRIRAEARDTIAARRALAVLNAPRPGTKAPEIRTGPPEPAGVLWRHYRQAARRSGVPVDLLAAVNLIESDFGRVRNESVAGAQGPMQFMPATWDAYGLGGDATVPRDAIRGAANYLAANGGSAGTREALANAVWNYNHSDQYVAAVLAYSDVMRDEPVTYRGFHAWDVLYLTAAGTVRLEPGYESPEPIPVDTYLQANPDALLE